MTHIKICGITNLDDALAAAAAGADYLGFIFYPPSPRSVAIPEAVGMIHALRTAPEFTSPARPGGPPLLVGVFVNESAQTMADIVDACKLDLAQLSGEEDSYAVLSADSPLLGRAYKAIRPRDPEEATRLTAHYIVPTSIAAPGLPRLLLDSYHPSLRGGSGSTGDWPTAAALAAANPQIMLAGGLTPDNVAEAVRAVRPWAVDVASGVEAAPGRKDHERLRAFIAAVRSASNE